MVTFLSPVWFFALLTLLVPILIHLWSKGEQSIIRIGSTRFLATSTQKIPRRIALSDIPLLLLQLTLLLLLTLLLTRPVWQPQIIKRKPAERWVLVSPRVYQPIQDLDAIRAIDSLEAIGYQTAWLAPEFPRLTNQRPPVHQPATTISLLKEFDARLPDSSSIFIVAPAYLSSIQGALTSFNSDVSWYRSNNTSTNQWISHAHRMPQDSLFIALGSSNASSTVFESFFTPSTSANNIASSPLQQAFEIQDTNTLTLLSNDGVLHDNVFEIRDQPTWQVHIFHDQERMEDVRYVEAALQAAVETHAGLLQLKISSTEEPLPENSDSLHLGFWLSEHPVPEALFASLVSGGTLIEDQLGSEQNQHKSHLIMAGPTLNEPPYIFTTASTLLGGAPEWTDAFGNTMMVRMRAGKNYHYRFQGRFHPSSTSLVTHSQWPKWINDLIQQIRVKKYIDTSSDLRQISVTQINTLALASPDKNNQTTPLIPNAWPLFRYIVILVLLVFIVEYVVAYRRIKSTTSR